MDITDVVVLVRMNLKSRGDSWKPHAAAEWFVEAAAYGVAVEVSPDPVPELGSDLAVVVSSGKRYVLTTYTASDSDQWVQAIPEQERLAEVERTARMRAEFAEMPQPPF